jgi:hypothetical protein
MLSLPPAHYCKRLQGCCACPLQARLFAKHLFFLECHPERSEGPQRRSNIHCSFRGTPANHPHALEFSQMEEWAFADGKMKNAGCPTFGALPLRA